MSEYRLGLVQKVWEMLSCGKEQVTREDVRSAYNAEGTCKAMAFPKVQAVAEEAREDFVGRLFAAEAAESLSESAFLAHYRQVSRGIRSERYFALLIFKQWKVRELVSAGAVEGALWSVKCKAYKERIRLKEFFEDFDKLRCGYVSETQLMSGLSMAGILLSPGEMQLIADLYKEVEEVGEPLGLPRVCYRAFCAEVDSCFTTTAAAAAAASLEECPTSVVGGRGTRREAPLLDTQRFQRSDVLLPLEEEEVLACVFQRLRSACKIKRLQVKQVFDDACRNQNSAMAVGQVTRPQFMQAITSKLGLSLEAQEVELLCKKFATSEGMVNYVACANTIDPPAKKYDPYSFKYL